MPNILWDFGMNERRCCAANRQLRMLEKIVKRDCLCVWVWKVLFGPPEALGPAHKYGINNTRPGWRMLLIPPVVVVICFFLASGTRLFFHQHTLSERACVCVCWRNSKWNESSRFGTATEFLRIIRSVIWAIKAGDTFLCLLELHAAVCDWIDEIYYPVRRKLLCDARWLWFKFIPKLNIGIK